MDLGFLIHICYLSGDSINPPASLIGDYSWILLTPVTGQLGGDSLFHRQSSYDMDKASFQPHYLKIFSLRYQIETQLTPTCYGASIRLEQKQGKALSLYLHAAEELTMDQVDKRTLALRQEGKTETKQKSTNDVHSPANEYGYSCY